jgi:ubiquinone/menaquinone biosynthesis C-methylase UbiE
VNLKRFFAAQLRKPAGWFGSAVMARMFDVGNNRLVDIAVRMLDPQPGDAVLDIGFGGGQSLVKTAGKVPHGLIAGVDFSPEMVARASQRIRRLGLDSRVKIHLGDGARLPFRDASFNRILTVNTIYFWPDLAAGLKEIARTSKPGGRLAIGMRSRACMAPWSFTNYGFTLYDPDEVAAAMAAAGFPVIALEHSDKHKKVDNVVIVGERA